jgi:hypothetical protein
MTIEDIARSKLDDLATFATDLPDDDTRDEFRSALTEAATAIADWVEDERTASFEDGVMAQMDNYPTGPEEAMWEHRIVSQVSDWLDDLMQRQEAHERCQFCDTPSRRHHPYCIVAAVQ